MEVIHAVRRFGRAQGNGGGVRTGVRTRCGAPPGAALCNHHGGAVGARRLAAASGLNPRLRDQVPYRDLGPLYFARLDQDRTAQRLARRIKELGYEVQIRKAA